MSKGKKAELAKVFKAFDTDGNGKLDINEVRAGYLEHYGKVMSDADLEKMFNSIDIDKSGYIDYTEFIAAAVNEKEINNNENLMIAFKMFDKDVSGQISA